MVSIPCDISGWQKEAVSEEDALAIEAVLMGGCVLPSSLSQRGVAAQINVDLSQASPGLMHLNFWSKIRPAAMLISSESILILSPGEETIALELRADVCNEDLLADLAYVFSSTMEASTSGRQAPCESQVEQAVLETALDLRSWSEASGFPNLLSLIDRRISRLRVSGSGSAAEEVTGASPIDVALSSRTSPGAVQAGATTSSEFEYVDVTDQRCSKAQGGQPSSPIPQTLQQDSELAPPSAAWPLIHLAGLVSAAIRSFTDGTGEKSFPS